MTGPILHLHTGHGWGGGEAQVLALVRGLVRRGVSTVLFAREGGALDERARASGAPVVPFRLRPGASWLPARLAIRGTPLRDAPPPLLLHAHDSLALHLALQVRDPAPVVLSRRVASPLRRNPWSRSKYRSRGLAAIVAVSAAVERVLRASGIDPGRIRVVPSGTDLAALASVVPAADVRALAGGRPLVGGLGELSRKKDFMLLVGTAHELKRRGVAAHWVVAGDGPEARRLRRAARRLGLEGDISFLGFRRDAEAVIAALDVFFFPSRAEGAPGAVREAMLLGVPVVARAAAGTVETLGTGGLVLRRGDPLEAADLVGRLLGDAALARRLTARARDDARRRFDIEATCAATIDVYRDVLGADALAEGSPRRGRGEVA